MENKPKYRETYERKSVIIGRALARLGLTPTMMTVSSIIIAICSLFFFARHELLLALLVIILAGVFDIFDGAIARATGKASKYGTVLDNTADRIVEAIVLLGFVLGGYVAPWVAIVTLMSMYLPSYVRARGEAELGIKALGVGIFERKEKLGSLFAGIILAWYFDNPIFTVNIAVLNTIALSLLDLVCIVVIIGSLISALQRLLFFRRQQ